MKRGFTLLEVVVAMTLFGVFLFILVSLTADMRYYDRRYPVNYMTHPQVGAVLARLRSDVYNAIPPYYPETHDTYTQSPETLILSVHGESGGTVYVVWDFTVAGEARRRLYNVGVLSTEWVARGVPAMKIDAVPVEGSPFSVRVLANDATGKIAIDQQYQPRPHK